MKNYTYWHGAKNVNDTGCACADTDSCKSMIGSKISCNCDDDHTGMTDDNLLTAKNQLPVKGKFPRYTI